MSNVLINTATDLLQVYDKSLNGVVPKDLADIVKFHGKGAAVASAAAGVIPGAGGAAAAACYAGFVWSMYCRLGKKIDIPFNKHILKSLAAAVVTNVAASAAVTLVATSVISLFPGIGSVAASAVDAAMGYAVVTASGVVYMKILTRMFKDKVDPTVLNTETFNNFAKDTMDALDIKGILKESKNEYKAVKNENIDIDESDSDEYVENDSNEYVENENDDYEENDCNGFTSGSSKVSMVGILETAEAVNKVCEKINSTSDRKNNPVSEDSAAEKDQLESRLLKIKGLYEKGLIDEAEYIEKKKEIISLM